MRGLPRIHMPFIDFTNGVNMGSVNKRVISAMVGVQISLAAFSGSAVAGPIYTFSTSVGTQSSDAGVITLTQADANSVLISVDLGPGYGFINSGGPHTPFAFNLNVSGGLSISSWSTPIAGSAGVGKTFNLNTSGGNANPYGGYNTALDYTGGNGSSSGYYGDLLFTLTRVGGLDTTNFVANSSGYYFAADLSNGSNTGSQAWSATPTRFSTTEVPEPFTLSLFGAGLLGAYTVVLSRRRSKKSFAA